MGLSSQTYSHSLDFGLIGFLAEAPVAPSCKSFLQSMPSLNGESKFLVH